MPSNGWNHTLSSARILSRNLPAPVTTTALDETLAMPAGVEKCSTVVTPSNLDGSSMPQPGETDPPVTTFGRSSPQRMRYWSCSNGQNVPIGSVDCQ